MFVRFHDYWRVFIISVYCATLMLFFGEHTLANLVVRVASHHSEALKASPHIRQRVSIDLANAPGSLDWMLIAFSFGNFVHVQSQTATLKDRDIGLCTCTQCEGVRQYIATDRRQKLTTEISAMMPKWWIMNDVEELNNGWWSVIFVKILGTAKRTRSK